MPQCEVSCSTSDPPSKKRCNKWRIFRVRCEKKIARIGSLHRQPVSCLCPRVCVTTPKSRRHDDLEGRKVRYAKASPLFRTPRDGITWCAYVLLGGWCLCFSLQYGLPMKVMQTPMSPTTFKKKSATMRSFLQHPYRQNDLNVNTRWATQNSTFWLASLNVKFYSFDVSYGLPSCRPPCRQPL